MGQISLRISGVAVIVSIAESLNASRVIGLTTSIFALVACAVAWLRGRRASRRRRFAAVLTLLEAVVLLDLVFNGRWLLHNLLSHMAMVNHIYVQRSGPQHVALGLLGIVIAAGIGLALWTFRGRPGASLAAFGGMLSLCCWWVEVISLHAVDSLLYQRLDGVTLVRLAWAACSLMTGAGVLWDTFPLPAQATECETESPSASLTPF